MPTADWRQMLEQALDSSGKTVPYADEDPTPYYQVATVDEDRRPLNRTVAHRGFYGDNALMWCTDCRSNKVAGIEHEPWAEACFYLPSSREQFRLSGPLTIVGNKHSDSTLQEQRQVLWSSLPPLVRKFFTQPDPGQPRQDDISFRNEPPAEDSTPLDTFCLVIHDVQQADYLSVKENKRLLFKSSASSAGQRQWTAQNVNP